MGLTAQYPFFFPASNKQAGIYTAANTMKRYAWLCDEHRPLYLISFQFHSSSTVLVACQMRSNEPTVRSNSNGPPHAICCS